MKTQKVYTINGPTGPQFAINANGQEDAEGKLFNWLRYHSMTGIAEEYSVIEAPDTKWTPEEYACLTS